MQLLQTFANGFQLDLKLENNARRGFGGAFFKRINTLVIIVFFLYYNGNWDSRYSLNVEER